MDAEKPDAHTLRFLKCAFPDGLDESEYYMLLYILLQDMTYRAASWLVGVLLSKSYMDIYNDALGVKSRYIPDQNKYMELKKRLDDCGYEEWLDSTPDEA